MTRSKLRIIYLVSFLVFLSLSVTVSAQNTQIKGFVAASAFLEDDKFSFGIGEQDLFITSQLNDNFSFLGETVFKYSPNSATQFDVSVERIIISYNYKGNHSALLGKHHTPTHYWNDTYHHGRVFFPTIDRPLMFAANTFPIHTTGLAMTGLNLGNLRFGYNLMVGNGIGSSDVVDNDTYKSITAAATLKPWKKLHLGASFYHDIISEGATDHGQIIPEKINQQLYTATIANFGSRFEVLAEATLTANQAESTGTVNAFATYIYTGWKINNKFVPYLRYDLLNYSDKEIFYQNNNDRSSILVGFRYEISYLIVAKIEFQHFDSDNAGSRDLLNAQIAIGF